MVYDKLIINLAMTGMLPTKEQNPHIPLSPDEIAEDCDRAFHAGVSIVHLHARDSEGKPTYKIEVFREIVTKIRQKCPDLIVCVTTSGRTFKSFEERSQALELETPLKPDMASLTLGSFNFPKEASVNGPEMIAALARKMNERNIVPELEVFDLGMIDFAKHLIEREVLKKPLYFNLFLGSLGTLQATPLNLSLMVNALPPSSVWAATGIGRTQHYVNSMAISMGGHVRVGLEDNLYFDADRKVLASNAQLVERIVNISRAMGREIASPAEARQMIGLSGKP